MLYHWQKFNKKWLIETLINNTIFCSSPIGFNDPWDCKLNFNIDIYNDLNERKKLAKWIIDGRNYFKDEGFSDDDIRIMENRTQDEIEYAKNFVLEHVDVLAAVPMEYRIYCLGTYVENILMWSHYADSHKGICLEFKLPDKFKKFAFKCNYQEEYPILKLHDKNDGLKLILSKSVNWEYENEYRILAQERCYALESYPLVTDNGVLQLPEGAISSVIVGCKGDFEEVKALVGQFASNVKVKHALQVDSRYAIRIENKLN